jgi:predicted DNA binding protein
MTYYELTFKLQHDCPYCDFSKGHPSAVISHWCNWSRDVLEITHRDLASAKIQQAIRAMLKSIDSKVRRTTRAISNFQVVLQHCACDKLPPPTLPTIEKRNCLNLQPMVYTGGWEWYHVVAFSDRDIRSLFKDLEKHCTIEVTSRRAISEELVHDNLLISTASLLGSLTGKQAGALVTALDNGYYNLPRSVTAVEIAERLGIPRTSFVDHLRKAQNKVIQAVGPYARLHATGMHGDNQGNTDK